MKKKNVRVNLMSYIFLFLVLAGVLYFMDSLNTRVNRIELKELNSYIENKKIDRVLFVKLDRWSRGVRNYYKLFDILERNNCNWQTIFEKYFAHKKK